MTDLSPRPRGSLPPLFGRTVIRRVEARFGPLQVVSASEDLSRPTDWRFADDSHKIVVHLDGRLDRMECEFSSGPSASALPEQGDIWIIPAGCRYAALAQGDRAEFVELTIPTGLLGEAKLTARVRHRDPFLSAAAARLAELMARPDDDLAAMAAQAIANALPLHLREQFGEDGSAPRRRALSAADRRKLVETVEDHLDAELSLERLAGVVDMDVRRFTDAFREAFGLSPWRYVGRARLERAAELLARTDRSVTDIALAVGFATPSHFATAFSSRFGAPPSRYRALSR